MDTLLQVEHLNVNFPTQTGEVAAVRDVTFSIPESGTLGRGGESGSGKSATALAIMRLLPPQARISGVVRFSGNNPLARPEDAVRRGRGAGRSAVFRAPLTAVTPAMPVGN